MIVEELIIGSYFPILSNVVDLIIFWIIAVRVYFTEGGWLWIESNFHNYFWGVSGIWLKSYDITGLISREEFTFVLCKQVEGKVMKFSVSVLWYWVLSKKIAWRFKIFRSCRQEVWLISHEILLNFPTTISWRIFRRVVKTLKRFSLTFVNFGVM